ncbi:olfactory receptor 14A16-like [Hemicordylus capensis]|uniref:olfactory receptor 14A16-like n=1 Tax=Hemicordylus capensis TaxID=884348 RepID=UPI0023035E49|nr:olfactory receptor 14A16-like [Hemicordylus capensis]
MANQSFVTEFQLLGFSEVLELHMLFFMGFLLVYLAAVIGNLLIVVVVASNRHLQTPMYFFLVNLNIVDLSFISVTIPKAMANSLMKTRIISYYGCMAQVFFFFWAGASEFFLLTMMAYDRYVAICNPLNYVMEMNREACIKMAATAWIFGLFDATLNTACTFAITFCSNTINQFFCEIPQLLKLSCSNSYFLEIGALIFTVLICISCFGFTIISYVHIFRAVFNIPSAQGRKKAFSTCVPHLFVLCLFYFTGVYACLGTTFRSSSGLDLLLAVLYSVVPPFMNPIIYSMRNKEITAALWRLSHKKRNLISMQKHDSSH